MAIVPRPPTVLSGTKRRQVNSMCALLRSRPHFYTELLSQTQADKLAFVLGADPEPDRAVAAFKHWSYDFMVKKIAQIEHHTDEGHALPQTPPASASAASQGLLPEKDKVLKFEHNMATQPVVRAN